MSFWRQLYLKLLSLLLLPGSSHHRKQGRPCRFHHRFPQCWRWTSYQGPKRPSSCAIHALNNKSGIYLQARCLLIYSGIWCCGMQWIQIYKNRSISPHRVTTLRQLIVPRFLRQWRFQRVQYRGAELSALCWSRCRCKIQDLLAAFLQTSKRWEGCQTGKPSSNGQGRSLDLLSCHKWSVWREHSNRGT